MTHCLFVKSSPKPVHQSNSLSVGHYLAERLVSLVPNMKLEEVDVYRADIPMIDIHFLEARSKLSQGMEWRDLLAEEQEAVRAIHRYTNQFIAADLSIFAFPLWNFSVPPLLKAYIDTIKVARKTFAYTSEGPVGLLQNKTAVLIQSSGDIYSEGPLRHAEHGSRYLKSVLSFIGITKIHTIYMEGMDKDRDRSVRMREQALRQAEDLAGQLAASIAK